PPPTRPGHRYRAAHPAGAAASAAAPWAVVPPWAAPDQPGPVAQAPAPAPVAPGRVRWAAPAQQPGRAAVPAAAWGRPRVKPADPVPSPRVTPRSRPARSAPAAPVRWAHP